MNLAYFQCFRGETEIKFSARQLQSTEQDEITQLKRYLKLYKRRAKIAEKKAARLAAVIKRGVDKHKAMLKK